MQDLNDMLYFAEVADRAGFAAAGRHLNLPKSKLSRRVAALEASLGVRLLQRTTRKVSLTPAGDLFHRHCIAMRDAADAAQEAMQQARSEPNGTVRVVCPVTLAQTTFGPLWGEFLARYPQVRLNVQVSNRVVDLIEDGIDVALRVRASLDDSGSLVVKNLGQTRTALVAHPAQLKRQGQPLVVEDLQQLDTISMSGDATGAVWHLSGPLGQSFELVHRPRLVADDLLTLKHAVLCGTGMCMLPDYMCREELRTGQLVEVLPGWGPRPGIVHAVFPSRRGMVPAVRRFLDFLGEHLNRDRPQ